MVCSDLETGLPCSAASHPEEQESDSVGLEPIPAVGAGAGTVLKRVAIFMACHRQSLMLALCF